MNIDKSIIENILKTNLDIIETAKNVNELSHTRKQITSESLLLLSELKDKNTIIITSYKQVFDSLQNYISGITNNLNEFKSNIQLFQEIISNIDSIKDRLINIASNITNLIDIVNVIKKDTEEINELATNATIVSSKYHTISSVFEILSAKLNDLSVYINQNLEYIINCVNPIKGSIDNVKEINSIVLKDIEKGHQNYLEFLDKLGTQERVVDEQVKKAELSGEKIEYQKQMLDDINTQVIQMDSDASKAIEGSGNVIKIGGRLKETVELVSKSNNNPANDNIRTIDFISEQAVTIWQTAQNVNIKSKSQLEFSFSSLEFSKSIINESKELEETVKIFNMQSIENNQLAMKISTNIRNLSVQLNEIEKKINKSNETLQRFTDDYLKINDIMDILKTILKLIKIIGIYSRIEASRDPVTFEGFLTISKNIQKLQDNIRNMLPKIENNIKDTKILIDRVNESYQDISSVFTEIRKSSLSITNDLNEISKISVEAESLSKSILDESLDLDTLLNDLENYLNKLTEVVKKPIEGSAKNIERGKYIEEKSKEIKRMILQ